MSVAKFVSEFDVDTYNRLDTVEAADAAIRARGQIDDFLVGAADVVLAHNMEKRFGVCLLHRHNRIARGEWMVEYREEFEDEPALVTRPVTRAPARDRATPTVWAATESGYTPLEYSTDPLAARLLLDDAVMPDFLSDFAGLVQASPIGRYVGLGIVKRAFYEEADPGRKPVEYSGRIDRANVVLLRSDADIGSNAIVTGWTFRRPVFDPLLGCVPTTVCQTEVVCKKFCHQEDDGRHAPRHRPMKDHEAKTAHINHRD